jgi:hypothetical protein
MGGQEEAAVARLGAESGPMAGDRDCGLRNKSQGADAMIPAFFSYRREGSRG